MVDERVDVEPELFDLRRERAQRVGERLRLRPDVREDERAPGVDRDRHEAELVLREVGLLLAARRRAEVAVEAVRPGVVRALERLPALLPLGEWEAAMAASATKSFTDASSRIDKAAFSASPSAKGEEISSSAYQGNRPANGSRC